MVSMNIESTSAPGDRIAPATNEPTTAYGRSRFSMGVVTIPSDARMIIRSGSSQEIPSASTTCITNEK